MFPVLQDTHLFLFQFKWWEEEKQQCRQAEGICCLRQPSQLASDRPALMTNPVYADRGFRKSIFWCLKSCQELKVFKTRQLAHSYSTVKPQCSYKASPRQRDPVTDKSRSKTDGQQRGLHGKVLIRYYFPSFTECTRLI